MNLSPDVDQHSSLPFRAASSGDSAPAGGPGWILLVEDNPGDVALVREALGEHGFDGELTVLTDGEKAVQFIQAVDSRQDKCPDLLIVDLNLPRKSGREVLESVRQSSVCGRAPVVILTSSDADQDRNDAKRLGASRYILKPLLLDDFMRLGGVFKAIASGADA